MEYGVQVWAPTTRHGNWGIIASIEKYQMEYTRVIDGMEYLSYRERLQKLCLTTLLERRMHGDLIETYKIINGLVNCVHDMFHRNSSAYNTRNITVASHNSTKASHDLFCNRVIKYWNQLPSSVKNASNVNAFKAGLDHLKSCRLNSPFGYWNLSEEIFSRIPDSMEFKTYLMENHDIALRRNVSL